MTQITEKTILDTLSQVTNPHTQRDFVSAKQIKNIRLSADGKNDVALDVVLNYPAKRQLGRIQAIVTEGLQSIPAIGQISVNVSSAVVAHAVQRGVKLIPGVKNIIAVASGKGGVGKSTTAVNLALALMLEGARVGILDADIYGPSLPQMLGVQGQQPEAVEGRGIMPLMAHGLQAMSIGLLIDPEQPMVWRGPMVTQALMQLLKETCWQDLDYLIVDMPPGTGDIQLTLAQQVPVTGAVIVTTPQDIALLDARKGLKMFEKVGVPILGVVENMSIHICSQCGHAEPVFGSGGGGRMATDYAIELLGALPLDIAIRTQTDAGTPTVVADPGGQVAEIYATIARRLAVKLAGQAQDQTSKFPDIVIRNT
ncbi:MAG: iron-sulfur cluster carrier protein ApbC [Rugosibacter sp.]|jgi:ATP-binding protein involved in chromosome partitioning